MALQSRIWLLDKLLLVMDENVTCVVSLFLGSSAGTRISHWYGWWSLHTGWSANTPRCWGAYSGPATTDTESGKSRYYNMRTPLILSLCILWFFLFQTQSPQYSHQKMSIRWIHFSENSCFLHNNPQAFEYIQLLSVKSASGRALTSS